MILLYEKQSVTVQPFHTCMLKDTWNDGIQIAGHSFLLNVAYEKQVVQGGSNMTGTQCDLFTHKSVPVIFESPCI
jgi:hypothetical protein